jgi:putative sterol carrier protein
MKMKSDVANKYFQGKENVPIAVATGRIKTKGNMAKALKLIPITKPIYEKYRQMLEEEGYEHLLV